MSILINGMEMPKENDYTIVIVYGDGVVTEYHEDYWIRGADGEKQLGTAVPVLKHGRLVDADALIKVFKTKAENPINQETMPYSWSFAYECLSDVVGDMPTIIPEDHIGDATKMVNTEEGKHEP